MSSRTELLAWLNDLLQINYTKVEQCGAGGAYCQIMDTIFGASLSPIAIDVGCHRRTQMCPCFLCAWKGDVPMARVKMNAKHEYEYVANFKVLQNIFKAKRVDKVCCWISRFAKLASTVILSAAIFALQQMLQRILR
jgi:RP/EB family microtubule-associated protein